MLFSRTLALLLVLTVTTGVTLGQSSLPTKGAGILTTPNNSVLSNTGGDAFLWDESALYLHKEPTLPTEEITLPDDITSISGIRGMHMTFANNQVHFDRWIWNDHGVFVQNVSFPTTEEITTQAGESIPNVGGIVTFLDNILIWNDSAVYIFPTASTTSMVFEAVEIKHSTTSASVSNTRGIITFAGTTHAYIWTDDGVFNYCGGLTPCGWTVEEVTQSGAPITDVRGILSATVPQAAVKAWIWNDSGVYLVSDLPSLNAVEITHSGSGSSIANVRGLVTDNQQAPGVWMWNDSGVYLHTPTSLLSAQPVPTPSGSAISNVRGMLATQDHITYIWNDSSLFRQVGVNLNTAEITLLGSSIPNVRGMISSFDLTAPVPPAPPVTVTWGWNDTDVFLIDNPFVIAGQITHPNGAPISDVRGMVGAADFSNGSITGSQVFCWSPTGVFLHNILFPIVEEITTTTGASLQNTWCITYGIDNPTVSGRDIWIRTDQQTFLQGGSTPDAVEVVKPNGASLSSPSFAAPASAMAIVRNYMAGAGAVNAPAPFEVDFVGMPVQGAVHFDVAADDAQGLTSVISGNESHAIAAGGSRSTVHAGFPSIAAHDVDTGYAVLLIASSGASDASFRRGDCNNDDTLDITDAIAALGILFGGAGSPDCWDSCDANDDSTMNIADVVFTLGYLFGGGPPPPDPGPVNCGPDPTVDSLDCVSYDCL